MFLIHASSTAAQPITNPYSKDSYTLHGLHFRNVIIAAGLKAARSARSHRFYGQCMIKPISRFGAQNLGRQPVFCSQNRHTHRLVYDWYSD